jgi:hypothetical protein
MPSTPRSPDNRQPSGPPALFALKLLFALSVVLWLRGHGDEPHPHYYAEAQPYGVAVYELPSEEAEADLGQHPSLQLNGSKPARPWQSFRGTLPIPEAPYPWQRKPPPPCSPRLERQLNGGCWTVLSAKPEPACPDGTWQTAEGCYWPAVAEARPPTSVDGGTK